MAVNRGKKFEEVVKQSMLKVKDVSLDRLHDQTNGYLGSRNICDFIAYKHPYQYYIECKSIHGNTFPLSNITENQYNGLLEKSKIKGVMAGLIIWYVDKDVTKWVPIQAVQTLKVSGYKSINYCFSEFDARDLQGKKKRVFFDYNMNQLFTQLEYDYRARRVRI